MSTRLLLEGADLPELMVHVRAEFGPRARIVHAERIRSGGLAGFFARERYELTIEVPDEPIARPRAMRRAPAPAVGLDALLAAADAAEVLSAADIFDSVDTGRAPTSASSGASPAAGALGGAASGTSTAGAPAAGVGAGAGAGGAGAASGGPADAASTGVGPDDGSPRVSTGAESFASVLDQVRSMAGGHALTADVDVPAPDTRVFSPMTPPAATPAGIVARPTPPANVRAGLLDLGVPEHLLAHVGGPGPALLSDLLAHVPQAPELPRAPGSVVVVVGAPDDAEAVAGQLAERLRQSRAAVVMAGEAGDQTVGGPARERRLATTASAARWRSRGPEAGQVGVVTLGVGPDAQDRAAAAALLDALSPHQVWGVVDARTKTRDSALWLAEVGARRAIDVLAVRGAFETTQPGTVLDLGVPVAWIDGIPATTVAWAAALSQRLGPTARWD